MECFSSYSDYATDTTEATLATTEGSAIDFIKALLIVVAFDDPVSSSNLMK